jgi:hypothetical protein
MRPTRLLSAEALLELQDRQWKTGTRHATKLRDDPDGANPVRTSELAERLQSRELPLWKLIHKITV